MLSLSSRLIGVVVAIAAAATAWWLLRPQEPRIVEVSRHPATPTELPAPGVAEPAPPQTPAKPTSDYVIPSDPAARQGPHLEASIQRLEPGEAQAMIRRHIEEDVSRYYEDIGPALRLDEDERFGLVRTLAEHQVQLVELPFERDPMIAVERRRELQQAQREDLQSLLGPARYAKLDAYQKSLGARVEVQELARSVLIDPPISEAQRRKLVRAAIDAGAYYDEPDFTGAESQGVLLQESLAKMEQRDAKMIDVVQRVLGAGYVPGVQSFQDGRRRSQEYVLRQRSRVPR